MRDLEQDGVSEKMKMSLPYRLVLGGRAFTTKFIQMGLKTAPVFHVSPVAKKCQKTCPTEEQHSSSVCMYPRWGQGSQEERRATGASVHPYSPSIPVLTCPQTVFFRWS